jgi:hypothetical protein
MRVTVSRTEVDHFDIELDAEDMVQLLKGFGRTAEVHKPPDKSKFGINAHFLVHMRGGTLVELKGTIAPGNNVLIGNFETDL